MNVNKTEACLGLSVVGQCIHHCTLDNSQAWCFKNKSVHIVPALVNVSKAPHCSRCDDFEVLWVSNSQKVLHIYVSIRQGKNYEG